MKKIIIKIIFFLSIISSTAFAGGRHEVDVPYDSGFKDIGGVIKSVLEAGLKIILPIIVLAYVYVGFLFIKAQGEEKELTAAKEAFLNVSIGAVIVILSVAFYNIIMAALK